MVAILTGRFAQCNITDCKSKKRTWLHREIQDGLQEYLEGSVIGKSKLHTTSSKVRVVVKETIKSPLSQKIHMDNSLKTRLEKGLPICIARGFPIMRKEGDMWIVEKNSNIGVSTTLVIENQAWWMSKHRPIICEGGSISDKAMRYVIKRLSKLHGSERSHVAQQLVCRKRQVYDPDNIYTSELKRCSFKEIHFTVQDKLSYKHPFWEAEDKMISKEILLDEWRGIFHDAKIPKFSRADVKLCGRAMGVDLRKVQWVYRNDLYSWRPRIAPDLLCLMIGFPYLLHQTLNFLKSELYLDQDEVQAMVDDYYSRKCEGANLVEKVTALVESECETDDSYYKGELDDYYSRKCEGAKKRGQQFLAHEKENLS